MNDQTISCQQCGNVIALSEALTEKLRHKLEGDLMKEVRLKEEELQKKSLEVEASKKEIEEEVEKRLKSGKLEMWERAQKKAAEKLEVEMKDLEKANKEKSEQLDKMREEQLELRKQKREIEEEKKNMKLEVERRLDEERKLIAELAKKDAAEEMRLKLAEKDKQLEQMKRSVEDLKRKSEQGSMQIQGDVQEDDLKFMLERSFPSDVVEDVPTGVRGADLIQKVRDAFGKEAGVILWESKNTKAWNDEWVKKLREDQALVKADLCVLVSQTLPKDVEHFECIGGVWVCSYSSALSLVSALRMQLKEVNKVKQSLVGKDEKMELLYNYLAGNEFKNRIENIVSAFSSMKADLDREKRAIQKIWKKRDKEIERVIENTASMYGDLQGIVGASLATVEALQLPGEEDY